MVKTIRLETNVTTDHELHIKLPNDFPEGMAEITLVVESQNKSKKKGRTFGDLLKSEFFGMWKDRDDIGDSVEYARKLQEKTWKRIR